MPEKKYIELDAAITAIAHRPHVKGWDDYEDGLCRGLEEAVNAICAIPAAEVREVVYCRECKHYKPQEKKSARWDNRSLMCTRSATIKMPPDGFCSFGVKREES